MAVCFPRHETRKTDPAEIEFAYETGIVDPGWDLGPRRRRFRGVLRSRPPSPRWLVSWLCGLAWVVLWARRTSTRINQVLSRTNRAAAELDRAAKRQLAIRKRVQGMAVRIADQGRLQQRTADQLRVTRKELFQVLVWVQRTPSVTQELGRAL